MPPTEAVTSSASSRWATPALLAICLAWGAGFTVTKSGLEDVSPLLFVALRFGVATIVLWIGLRLRGPLHLPVRTLRAGFLLALALFGGYAFQTVGLRYTTPSRSGFLTGLFIVFVPMLAAAVHRRMPSVLEFGGVLLALLGMLLLSHPLSESDTFQGDLLTVICALCYSVHILALGHFARHHDTRSLTLLQIAFTFLLSLCFCFWLEPVQYTGSASLWGAVLFTGVFATAIAFLVQTWAQQHTSPTRTALIFSMEPVFAWITAFLVFGEMLGGLAATGALLILAGVLVVELLPTWNRSREI